MTTTAEKEYLERGELRSLDSRRSPKPAAPPVAATFEICITPDPGELRKMLPLCQDSIVQTRAFCADKLRARVEIAKDFSPAVYARLEGMQNNINQEMANFRALALKVEADVGVLQNEILGRASALRLADEYRARLTDAKARLDGAGSLEIDAAEAFKLSQDLGKLPGRIIEEEKTAIEFEVLIRRHEKEAALPIQLVVSGMVRAARNRAGYVTDRNLINLSSGGYLELPDQ